MRAVQHYQIAQQLLAGASEQSDLWTDQEAVERATAHALLALIAAKVETERYGQPTSVENGVSWMEVLDGP